MTSIYQSVICPVCNAPAGEPCNVPTSEGRRDVSWVHVSREAAHQRALEDAAGTKQDFMLTFGVQYKEEPHPKWADCDPRGWVRIVADDYEQAREIATERFGLYWSQLTPGWRFQRHYFPAGEQMVLP